MLFLPKILLGITAIVVIRAVLRTRRRFDFRKWVNLDRWRIVGGYLLGIVVWAVIVAEPTALEVLAIYGLRLSPDSAVVIGLAIGGFALWIPTKK